MLKTDLRYLTGDVLKMSYLICLKDKLKFYKDMMYRCLIKRYLIYVLLKIAYYNFFGLSQ